METGCFPELRGRYRNASTPGSTLSVILKVKVNHWWSPMQSTYVLEVGVWNGVVLHVRAGWGAVQGHN